MVNQRGLTGGPHPLHCIDPLHLLNRLTEWGAHARQGNFNAVVGDGARDKESGGQRPPVSHFYGK